MGSYKLKITKRQTRPFSQALTVCAHFLVGQNSNAYNLLGGWADAATKNGWNKEDVDKVIEQATSGDYENLLRVLATHSTPE